MIFHVSPFFLKNFTLFSSIIFYISSTAFYTFFYPSSSLFYTSSTPLLSPTSQHST